MHGVDYLYVVGNKAVKLIIHNLMSPTKPVSENETHMALRCLLNSFQNILFKSLGNIMFYIYFHVNKKKKNSFKYL